jgi:transcription antitermination factor NusG
MFSRTGICLPWFACYVKPRHEKHVALILEAKGYSCFVPTYLKRSRKHRCELPLFPGYVFSRLDPTGPVAVTSTPGVFFILGNGRGLQSIPDDEIEAIRRMIASGFCPRPWPYLTPGVSVHIAQGPLRGVTGVVVPANSDRWLVISVHLLQRSVAVKLDRSSLPSLAICANASAGDANGARPLSPITQH